MTEDNAQELELARNAALAYKAQAKRTEREALRTITAIVRACGGRIEVPYRLLVEDGELMRMESFENGGMVVFAVTHRP